MAQVNDPPVVLRKILNFKIDAQWPDQLTFSPDGKCLLCRGITDRVFKLWDTSTGEAASKFEGHTDRLYWAAFRPRGNQIASGRDDHVVKLWDVSKTREISTVALSPQWCNPNGTLAVGAGPAGLYVWDPSADGKMRILAVTEQRGRVSGFAFSPGDPRIGALTLSRDKVFEVWDLTNCKKLHAFEGHKSTVNSVAYSPNGGQIVTGSADMTVKLWDASSGRQLLSLEGHAEQTRQVAFSPDGNWIASALANTLKVWHALNGRELRTIPFRELAEFLFSPDGKRILIRSTHVPCIAFGGDDKIVVTGSQDNAVRIWDSAAGKLMRTFTGHTGPVNTVATSREGRIVSGSNDRTVKVWDIAQAKEITTLRGHTGEVASVALSPDGKWIASGSLDKTIKLWDAVTGRELRTLKGHTQAVQGVAFSPDGTLIASASDDASVRVWDASNGSEIHFLKGHTSGALDVAFSPDGQRLVSGGQDRINVWHLTDVGRNSP